VGGGELRNLSPLLLIKKTPRERRRVFTMLKNILPPGVTKKEVIIETIKAAAFLALLCLALGLLAVSFDLHQMSAWIR
jgi:hypothetical protein